MTNPINNRISLLPALDLGKTWSRGGFVKRVTGPAAGISGARASSTRSSGPCDTGHLVSRETTGEAAQGPIPCDMSHDATGRGPWNRAMVSPKPSETT
jgi:hypothetical protein